MFEFLKEKSAEERLQLLRDNCTKTEFQEVKIYYTDEELACLKDELSEDSISCSEIEDKLAEISKDFKAQIKQKKVAIKQTLHALKHKYYEESQDVYLFANQETGLMETFNRDGEIIATRRLRPEEKQQSIFNINQTKTA